MFQSRVFSSARALPTVVVLAALVLLSIIPLSLVNAQEPARPAGLNSVTGRVDRAPRSVNQLIQDLQTSGRSTRVIVALNAAFQPAGGLSASEALGQENRIAQSRAAVVNSVTPLGAKVVANSNQWSIPFVAMSVNAAALQALQNSPQVISIQEDIPVPATNNQISLVNQGVWVNNQWAKGYDGTGYTVAIVDTGVEASHSFLNGKVVAEYCSSYDEGTYEEDGDIYTTHSLCPGQAATATGAGAANPHLCDNFNIPEECEHGTHVAGIAAGSDNNPSTINDGVARGATIIATQVFTDFVQYCTSSSIPYDCALTFPSDQINALNHIYSLRNTYNIASVNMSLGGGFHSDQAICDAENSGTKAAIDQLRSVNIATIIATGNDFFDNGISEPGCISTAVAVGSISDSQLKISYFSNTHPMMDLLGSGQSINSSIPTNTFANLSGTSMATPQVAGAWAVFRQAFPNATVAQILQIMQQTGTPIVDNKRSNDPSFPGYNDCYVLLGFDYFYSPCSNGTYKLINLSAAINSQQLSAFSALLPANDAFLPPSTSVKLTWGASTHATHYELQIDTVNPPVATPINVTGTSYTLNVQPGDFYYWRVRAVNLVSQTQYTDVRKFSVDGAPPRGFFTTATPVLTWSLVSGAVKYEVQIANNATFTSPLPPVFATTPFVTSPTLTDGIWYWRVRACATTSSCTGTWSAAEPIKIDS